MRAIAITTIKEAIANGVTTEIFAKEFNLSLEYTNKLFKVVKSEEIKGEYIILP